MEESILLYRKEDGSAVAMSNRCAHRFAPLNRGKLRGDSVECPYHGLVFNALGQCIHNPHPRGNGPIPPEMKLRQYPIVERDGAIWIWMGERPADVSLIPDYHWISDTEHYTTNRGAIEIDCNYRSVADNLLDLTHLSYVHSGGLGPRVCDADGEQLEHVVVNNDVWCKRRAKNVLASMDFQMLNPRIRDVSVDKVHDVRWVAPAHSLISINYYKAGTQLEDSTGADIGHMATPISATKTLMFWSISRNFLLDSDEVTQRMEQFAHIAIDAQDAVIMAEQQRMMGDEWDLNRLSPVCLPNDISVNRARSILRRMIEEENGLIARSVDVPSLTAEVDG